MEQTWEQWVNQSLKEYLDYHGIRVLRLDHFIQGDTPGWFYTKGILTRLINFEPIYHKVYLVPPMPLSAGLQNELMIRLQGNLWPDKTGTFQREDYPFEDSVDSSLICRHWYSIEVNESTNPPIYTFIWKICYCH